MVLIVNHKFSLKFHQNPMKTRVKKIKKLTLMERKSGEEKDLMRPWLKQGNIKPNTIPQAKFQIMRFLLISIGETSKDLTLLINIETKVTVDHATPSVSLRLLNKDSN